jgi:hypothetical protein
MYQPIAEQLREQSKFCHRHNWDGAFDSICLKCYATAGNAKAEEALEQSEREHICDLFTLERFRAYSREN